MQNVKQATQSPLNPKQWLCVLECGCETWVTSARRPIRAKCPSNHRIKATRARVGADKP